MGIPNNNLKLHTAALKQKGPSGTANCSANCKLASVLLGHPLPYLLSCLLLPLHSLAVEISGGEAGSLVGHWIFGAGQQQTDYCSHDVHIWPGKKAENK